MSSEEESLDGDYIPDSDSENPRDREEQEDAGLGDDYIALFQAHVKQTKAHLRGATCTGQLTGSRNVERLNPQTEPDVEHVEAEEPAVEDTESDSYWTEDEKNLFFHSLTIYSRWRPDLVAQSIVTKSVTDVCLFIDRLDEALESCEDEDFPEDDEESVLEISEDELALEEKQAMLYAALEVQGVEIAKQNARKRKSEEISGHTDTHTPPSSKRFKADTAGLEHEWRIQDAFEHLDEWMLKRMDYILRSSEEIVEDPQQVQDEELVPSRPLAVLHSNIDPVLVALSQPTSHFLPPFHRNPSTPDIAPSLPPSSAAPSDYGDDPEDPSELSEPKNYLQTLRDMSPKSRRRYKKMLHMRRKRGDVNTSLERSKRGRRAKLKPAAARRGPGRPQTCRMDATREDNDEDVEEIDVDARGNADGDGPDDPLDLAYLPPPELPDCWDPLLGSSPSPEENRGYRHPRLSGLTPPYKAQKTLNELKVTADTLANQGFSLFHLAKFSELINLAFNIHSPVFSSSPFGPDIGISGQTIRLLEAFVIDFVESVVKGAISNREHELALKQSKVWGTADDLSDEVKPRNIHNALTVLGIGQTQRKKTHCLERLIEEMKNKIRVARTMGEAEGEVTDEEEEYPTQDEVQPHQRVGSSSSLQNSSRGSNSKLPSTPSSSFSSSSQVKPDAPPTLQVPNLHPLPMCVAELLNVKRSLSYSEPLVSAIVVDGDEVMSLDSEENSESDTGTEEAGSEDEEIDGEDGDEGSQGGADDLDDAYEDSDGLASDDGS